MTQESIELPCLLTFEGVPSDVEGSGERKPPYVLLESLSLLGVEIRFDGPSKVRLQLELALERLLREKESKHD